MMLDRLADYYLQQGNHAKGKEAILKRLSFVGRYEYYKEYERLKKILRMELKECWGDETHTIEIGDR